MRQFTTTLRLLFDGRSTGHQRLLRSYGVSPTTNCGEIQTMSHIVNFCPLTKFDGGLLRLHEADEAAVDWLTTYGS